MATCGKTMTAHLLLAVAVAALSLSAALPLRRTRDTETAVDVNDVQLKLRFSLMAVDHVTQFLYSGQHEQMRKGCQLWNNVTASLQQMYSGRNSTESEVEEAQYIKTSTCKQISQTYDFDNVILEDGSCSEAVLEYLCSRYSLTESYSLSGDINARASDALLYRDWVSENFDETTADVILNYL